MNITLSDELIKQLKEACEDENEGYVPETQSEIEKAITAIVQAWIFNQSIS